uniref:Uncharacterized protein n=1 Tax=Cajanus cajan TaxID=3821 RepID=A0A151QXH6_CAJCA|nr:hypothetical protein KK1_043968 [Cajanus cajan]
MSLKECLSSITKGTSNVIEYLRSLHVIANELVLIGHPVDDLDLVIIALNSSGSSFCELTIAILTRDIPLMFDELFDKLIDFEIFMQWDDRHQQSFPNNHFLANELHPHLTHPMITRFKNGIFKPKQINIATKYPMPEPVEPSCLT